MFSEGEAPATMEQADAALTTMDASPEPEVSPVAAEPAAPPETQARDEQGRFTSPPPKAEPEPVQAEAAPAPEIPGEPTTEPVAPAEDLPTFSYRADGQEFTIPGSAVGDEGIFIPKDHVPEVAQLLSAGKAAFGSVRQRLSEAADREKSAVTRAEASEAQAQHILAHFEQLIDSGTWQQWAESAAQSWPILKAEAKAKAIEMQGKLAQEQLAKYQERDEQARMKPLMKQAVETYAQQYGTQAGLDAEAIAELAQTLQEPRFENLTIVRAQMDDPTSGIKKGDFAVDLQVVQAEAQRVAKWAKRVPKAPAVTAPKKPAEPMKIPPTVGAKGTKAPRQGAQIPTFKSAREADDWFASGGYNEIDVG